MRGPWLPYTSKRIHKISCDLLISVAAEKSHHAPPSQELFQKSTIENIYYTMVVTVFLLFCTVLSFTWGPKCILCVWNVIYQEFCEILWRVFVLVLLYLVSCIFFYGLFSFYVRLSLSLTYSFSVLPFFNSNWLPLLYTVFPGSNRKRGVGGKPIDIYQKKHDKTKKPQQLTIERN